MIMFKLIGCGFKFRLYLLNRRLEIVDNSNNNSTKTIITTHKFNKKISPKLSIIIDKNPKLIQNPILNPDLNPINSHLH